MLSPRNRSVRRTKSRQPVPAAMPASQIAAAEGGLRLRCPRAKGGGDRPPGLLILGGSRLRRRLAGGGLGPGGTGIASPASGWNQRLS